MKETEFYLLDLESRFKKINPKKYYLSYSGGKDSHFLYWFIKEWLHDTEIEIVSANTYMEHDEILKRMYNHANTILIPEMKPFEIKEQYGIPCFSKEQDFYIYYYQLSIRKGKQPSKTILQKINGTYKTGFNISTKARNYVLSGNAHNITHLCCHYLKKEPFRKYEKDHNKKAILGIRNSESFLRKTQYQSCFTKDKKFTPLHDTSDEMMERLYKELQLEIPNIYNHISRTGCAGCPYGSYKGETNIELDLLNDNKRKFVCDYFKESYEVLEIDTRFKQEQLF